MKTPHLSLAHINSAGSRGQHKHQHGDNSELLAPQLENLKSCLPTQTSETAREGLATSSHNVLGFLRIDENNCNCEQAKSIKLSFPADLK